VAYANWFNNKTKVRYNSYEGECLVIVWVIFHSKAIFMVAHSFWL